MPDDEIDFSDILERQFEETCAIAAVIGRPDLEIEIVWLGIEKGQKLRIGHEDIDVAPLTVIASSPCRHRTSMNR